jgi:hypothetical protein
MIFCIKNFHKNKNSSLTAKSIKYFGDYKVFLFNIYLNKIDHTDIESSLFEQIVDIKGKYNFGSGAGSKNNGYYFAEGINLILEHFKNLDDKVVILDEDHYFSNGETIRELKENNFHLAWAYWPSPYHHDDDMAANILAINPMLVSHLFPISEKAEYIEKTLREEVLYKIEKQNIYKIKNRNYNEYFGDGHFTNSVEEIEQCLKSRGIIK